MPKSLNSGCLFTDVQHIPGSFKVFVLFLSLCCRDNCSSCFFLIFTVGSCFQPRLSRMQLFDTPPGFDWSMKQMPPSLRKLHEGSSDLTQFHWYMIYLISLATIPVRCWISIKYYINILTIYIKLQTYRIILTYMCIQYSIYLSTIINYHHIYDI